MIIKAYWIESGIKQLDKGSQLRLLTQSRSELFEAC
jgi:hypothetical protein